MMGSCASDMAAAAAQAGTEAGAGEQTACGRAIANEEVCWPTLWCGCTYTVDRGHYLVCSCVCSVTRSACDWS